MRVSETPFKDLLIIEPKVHMDRRGYFFESYNSKALSLFGVSFPLVQENQSFSVKNVIRGLHFQRHPYAQGKLVRVAQGVIRDIVVDLRFDQPTFGRHFSIELSSINHIQLLVPAGFAHGFSVLSDSAEVIYGCDSHYNPEHDGGILLNDPALEIDWGVPAANAIISEKDSALPLFSRNSYGF